MGKWIVILGMMGSLGIGAWAVMWESFAKSNEAKAAEMIRGKKLLAEHDDLHTWGGLRKGEYPRLEKAWLASKQPGLFRYKYTLFDDLGVEGTVRSLRETWQAEDKAQEALAEKMEAQAELREYIHELHRKYEAGTITDDELDELNEFRAAGRKYINY